MHRSRTSKLLAVAFAGLAAAATAPLAASAAGATTVPAPIGVPCLVPAPADPATDLLTLTGAGVDFGVNGLDATNKPNCPSTVAWDTSGGTITPRISGNIILKNSLGVSARVIASYFDVHGTSLGPARATSPKVATSNAEQSFPITIDGFSSPFVYQVSIATQVLSGTTWVDIDRESEFLSSSNQPADPVLIAAVGQDFGTGPLVAGAPSGPGNLRWVLSGNTTKVQLTGDLIMTTSLGVNAHMRVRVFDVHGTELVGAIGGTKTPTTQASTTFPISLTTPPNPLIYRAESSIEVLAGGSWVTVGTPVVSYI
jgi:hypothetical protein